MCDAVVVSSSSECTLGEHKASVREHAPASTYDESTREPAVPFENNAAQQFVQMDQLARLFLENENKRKRTAMEER